MIGKVVVRVSCMNKSEMVKYFLSLLLRFFSEWNRNIINVSLITIPMAWYLLLGDEFLQHDFSLLIQFRVLLSSHSLYNAAKHIVPWICHIFHNYFHLLHTLNFWHIFAFFFVSRAPICRQLLHLLISSSKHTLTFSSEYNSFHYMIAIANCDTHLQWSLHWIRGTSDVNAYDVQIQQRNHFISFISSILPWKMLKIKRHAIHGVFHILQITHWSKYSTHHTLQFIKNMFSVVLFHFFFCGFLS